MDARSLTVLELPAVLGRLADETSFAGGRALAESLEPSPHADVVARRQAETSEAVALLAGEAPSLAGAHDVRDAAARAGRGGALLPDALAAIAETVRAAVGTRRVLLERRDVAPLLARRAEAILEALEAVAER